jgi:hypothetical protein
MQELESSIKEVITWLDSQSIGYALIGGLAISFRTVERFTKDIDLVIAVSEDSQAEKIVREISLLGYKVKTLLEQTKHGKIATVRLIKDTANGIIFVDLLFASSGIEQEIVMSAEQIDIFPNFPVNVASLPALLALKILSVDIDSRPQDVVDIKNLLKEADENEITNAKELLLLIQKRSYNRKKDLMQELSNYSYSG